MMVATAFRRAFGLRCLIGMCWAELYRPPHDRDQLWTRCLDCGHVLDPMNRRAEIVAAVARDKTFYCCASCGCDPKNRPCEAAPPAMNSAVESAA